MFRQTTARPERRLPHPGCAALLALLIGALSACQSGGARQAIPQAEARVVGQPPAASQDPFFFVAAPLDDDSLKDAPKAPGAGAMPPSAPATPASADTPPALGEALRPSPPANVQAECISCVRVCPLDPTTSECAQSSDDVICGWGWHENDTHAARMAQAQCDGALELARQMPMYQSIAGNCPVASCR